MRWEGRGGGGAHPLLPHHRSPLSLSSHLAPPHGPRRLDQGVQRGEGRPGRQGGRKAGAPAGGEGLGLRDGDARHLHCVFFSSVCSSAQEFLFLSLHRGEEGHTQLTPSPRVRARTPPAPPPPPWAPACPRPRATRRRARAPRTPAAWSARPNRPRTSSWRPRRFVRGGEGEGEGVACKGGREAGPGGRAAGGRGSPGPGGGRVPNLADLDGAQDARARAGAKKKNTTSTLSSHSLSPPPSPQSASTRCTPWRSSSGPSATAWSR